MAEPEVAHSATVRITHWLTTLAFAGLFVSGVAILLAHPRLYWGETGAVGTPSLLDLPLPFVFGHSGWGRYLHFLTAWLLVGTGVAYVAFGLVTRHFREDLSPARADRARSAMPGRYNALQRLAYLVVVFVLCPVAIWTGLAMSPAITSVAPPIVSVLGGQQSARTLHFFAAALLGTFVLVHVAMVWRAGFAVRVGAMITGRRSGQETPA